jgi:uncharacterized membrane protein SpoIIM required for sporulation
LLDKRKGRATLNMDEARELGTLYRAVASDLALSRRDYGNQRVTAFLNQLLTRAHSYIYQQDTGDVRQIFRYFTYTLPHTFRQTWIFTLVAFLMFIVPAVVGFHLGHTDPDPITDMLGLGAQRQTLADHETWTDIAPGDRPGASAFIMQNNIRLAILAFGGGTVFGLFAVYILGFNGLFIGTILGLAVHYDMGQSLLGFMFAHGVIELTVIFISAGAGLQLGWALLNPGPYTRRDALGLASRRAVILVMAAIPLLVIAGLIEGLISPANLGFATHAAVGIVSGIILFAYLGLVGRRQSRQS